MSKNLISKIYVSRNLNQNIFVIPLLGIETIFIRKSSHKRNVQYTCNKKY